MSDKRTQVLEASIDLFAEEGFWNTPTTRIAKHAGVGTGTLFNYFGSKEGLIDAVYMQLKQEWGTHILAGWPMDASIREQLEHMWYRYLDFAFKYPERYALKQQLRLSEMVSEETQIQEEEQMAFVVDLYNQAVSNGLLIEIPIEYFGLLMQSQVEAAIAYAQLLELQDMALLKHIALSFEIFWNSVRAQERVQSSAQ
ncbi:MAG: TetR/AcrR family transcriptional regulator [Candidatus Promineifilaceae bacterium]|jgi:AcrR family transcriptional regulator